MSAYYPITSLQRNRISWSHTPLTASWQVDHKKRSLQQSVRCLTQFLAFTVDDILLELYGVVQLVMAIWTTGRLSLGAVFAKADPKKMFDDKTIAWQHASTSTCAIKDQFAALFLRPVALVCDDVKLAVGIFRPQFAIGPSLQNKEEYTHWNKTQEGWLKAPFKA